MTVAVDISEKSSCSHKTEFLAVPSILNPPQSKWYNQWMVLIWETIFEHRNSWSNEGLCAHLDKISEAYTCTGKDWAKPIMNGHWAGVYLGTCALFGLSREGAGTGTPWIGELLGIERQFSNEEAIGVVKCQTKWNVLLFAGSIRACIIKLKATRESQFWHLVSYSCSSDKDFSVNGRESGAP
jgi:hypothetical protein